MAREIRVAAVAAVPREVCGLLVYETADQPSAATATPRTGARGADVGLLSAAPVRNVAAYESQFEFDGLDWVRVERAARRRGARVVGYFHSHVSGSAEPSAADRAGVSWANRPPLSHLIVSAQGGWALYDARAPQWTCIAQGA